MRVYLPATSKELAAIRTAMPDAELLRAAERPAHAVTKYLAASMPGADQDELEWEAFLAAATESAALLMADPAAAPMRVVLSVEVPAASISEPETSNPSQLSAVELTLNSEIEVAAIHVDEPATAPLIENLRSSPDSPSSLAAVLNADMLWYDPTEVDDIPIPQ